MIKPVIMSIAGTICFLFLLSTILGCSTPKYKIYVQCDNAIAYEYRQLLDRYAMETTGSTDFVQWQGHDFSMRGISSMESTNCQAGHLLSFTGTDTIPAVYFLEKYYNADMEHELIGGSVPATEHSVMMCGADYSDIGGNDYEVFKNLLDLFPTGILSIVSDTFDLWKVCTEYLPLLKDKIISRNGKIVIRPDSGNPVDIICGEEMYTMDVDDIDEVKCDALLREGYSIVNINTGVYELRTRKHLGYERSAYTIKKKLPLFNENRRKGVIELLWDVFGGTTNEQGYKVIDPHIGAIYGDSITLDRAEQICERLKNKGFASTNIVFGIGSYTYQSNTRDTLGMAVKSTYCEMQEDGRIVGKEIYKDPVTDDGTKKSAKGLLRVDMVNGDYNLKDQCTNEEEQGGELKTVFEDGTMYADWTLQQVRRDNLKSAKR